MKKGGMLQVNKKQVHTLFIELHEALEDIKSVEEFITEQVDNPTNILGQVTELSYGYSQYDTNLIYRGASFAYIKKIIKKLDRAIMRVDSLKKCEEI